MPISYNIYRNDGQGGVVNYDAPIASTSELSWTLGALEFPSDNTFGVRAVDAVSGIEEANTDARVRIILDASGNDVTLQPNAVLGLSVTAMAGGNCWVTWGYDSAAQGGSPSSFLIYRTIGTTPDLVTPVASVAFQPGVNGYGCTLTGLAANTYYSVSVQAIGAVSQLAGPSVTVGLNNVVTPLSSVDSLVAVPSP